MDPDHNDPRLVYLIQRIDLLQDAAYRGCGEPISLHLSEGVLRALDSGHISLIWQETVPFEEWTEKDMEILEGEAERLKREAEENDDPRARTDNNVRVSLCQTESEV